MFYHVLYEDSDFVASTSVSPMSRIMSSTYFLFNKEQFLMLEDKMLIDHFPGRYETQEPVGMIMKFAQSRFRQM